MANAEGIFINLSGFKPFSTGTMHAFCIYAPAKSDKRSGFSTFSKQFQVGKTRRGDSASGTGLAKINPAWYAQHSLRQQMGSELDKIVACETCGLVQNVGPVPEGSVAECARCHFQLFRRRPNSRARTLAFSLAALILYFPSNFYPIITGEYHGLHTETTIFQGIKSLFTHQQYFIGSLVFFTSILSPALKIIGLLFLPLSLGRPRWKRARTWAYRIIRVIDPWNMLEVFLLAIAVSMIEMGRVAAVHPGAGVFSFTAVVALTLLATLSFDPRLLWDSSDHRPTV